MFEVERKFRLSLGQKAEVKVKLESAYGAGVELRQADSVFLRDSADLKSFTKGDPVMRVRVENGVGSMAFKRVVNAAGDRLELEIGVSDAGIAEQIIEAAGFHEVARMEKHRLSFVAGEMTFVVDEVAGLGPFLEIEVMCKSKDEAAGAGERILSAAVELGVGAEAIEELKYDQLIDLKKSAA